MKTNKPVNPWISLLLCLTIPPLVAQGAQELASYIKDKREKRKKNETDNSKK